MPGCIKYADALPCGAPDSGFGINSVMNHDIHPPVDQLVPWPAHHRKAWPAMPAHESPPLSVRIVDPVASSRPSSPGSPATQSPRPSVQLPSRVTSQLGLDPKSQSKAAPKDEQTGRNLAWYAGYGSRAVLEHRWFSWIRPKLEWTSLKPVIRCAVAVSSKCNGSSFNMTLQAWVGWVIQLIEPSQAALGQAACSYRFAFFADASLCPHRRIHPSTTSTCHTSF